MDKIYKIVLEVVFWIIYISCFINLVIGEITYKTKIGLIAGSLALFSRYMLSKSRRK